MWEWVVAGREERVRVRECVCGVGGAREVDVAKMRPSSSSVVLAYGCLVTGDVRLDGRCSSFMSDEISSPRGGGSVNDVQLLDTVVVDDPAYVDSSSSKLKRCDDDRAWLLFWPPLTVSMLSRVYSAAFRACGGLLVASVVLDLEDRRSSLFFPVPSNAVFRRLPFLFRVRTCRTGLAGALSTSLVNSSAHSCAGTSSSNEGRKNGSLDRMPPERLRL